MGRFFVCFFVFCMSIIQAGIPSDQFETTINPIVIGDVYESQEACILSSNKKYCSR